MIDSVPAMYRSLYQNADSTSTVTLDVKFEASGVGVVYVSGAQGNRQLKRKMAAKSAGMIKYICTDTKTLGSGRKTKYVDQEQFIRQKILHGWETGDPVCKLQAYDSLIQQFGNYSLEERSEWETAMDIHSGIITPAFSQWMNRVLRRMGFSQRRESISQTVPVNWMSICIEAAGMIRDTMKKAKVTRLINADEMFLQYYPKERLLLAPINVKRVGSNRSENEKKGCTVMVACEMFESHMLAPYLVMHATRNGWLAKQYSSWEGDATVTFQEKHWMDSRGCIIYLDWVKACFPGEKVGLIWDAASAHLATDVVLHAKELSITLGNIPAGLTSILQICDLIANKPIKGGFKRKYVSWKMRNDPGPGGKYKVSRDDVIHWLATSEFDASMHEGRIIEKSFGRYGQDHRLTDTSVFTDNLAKHEENSIYKSLLENQSSIDLEK